MQVAKTNGRKVRVYIQDTADELYHEDLKPFVNTTLSRNYTSSPSGEVHGHSHMVTGMFVGGNSQDTKIGLIRRFAQEGLVEIALQKVLGDTGSGSFTGIQSAHEDVLKDKTDYAKFVNMSYGGPSIHAPTSDLMKQGKEQGVFYFASIGNSGYVEGQDRTGFPGKDPSTIGVASHDKNGNRSSFSSVDSSKMTMFCAAPGSSVSTTLKDGSYGIVSGTSFSGPAACAMGIVEYLLNPAITKQADLEKEFIDDLTDLGVEGPDIFLGHGTPIMTEKFFSTPQPPPPDPDPLLPPTLLTPANNAINIEVDEIELQWSTVKEADSYLVQLDDTKEFIDPIVDDITVATDYALQGLDNSTIYYWRVASIRGAETSEYSNVFKFTTEKEDTPEPPKEEWPTKTTPFKLEEVFTMKYKGPKDTEFREVDFNIVAEYTHNKRADIAGKELADKLRSYYSRSYIQFSREPDQHVVTYYIAFFTNYLFKKDVNVVFINSYGDGHSIVLEDQHLKKAPAMDVTAEIIALW